MFLLVRSITTLPNGIENRTTEVEALSCIGCYFSADQADVLVGAAWRLAAKRSSNATAKHLATQDAYVWAMASETFARVAR